MPYVFINNGARETLQAHWNVVVKSFEHTTSVQQLSTNGARAPCTIVDLIHVQLCHESVIHTHFCTKCILLSDYQISNNLLKHKQEWKRMKQN